MRHSIQAAASDSSVFGELTPALSDFVAARLGLSFPQERARELWRGIGAAAPELGFDDIEACARWLLTAVPARRHVDILASHLTVGETYFFRERESLDALAEQILPELLRRRRGGERHLRIWSAGCCTGEEAYSLAMLLDNVVPADEGWQVTILASDINPAFLRQAAAGIYGKWSFRTTPDGIKTRYFSKLKDGRWQLRAHVRAKVSFSYLNLTSDIYPSLMNGTNAMDVVLCRNVLMYFTADWARRAVTNFHRCLVDGGWLIVSHAETSNRLFADFQAVQFPGAYLYHKGESPVRIAPPPPQIVLPVPSPEPPPWRPLTPAIAPAVAKVERAETATNEREQALVAARDARDCADRGLLAEAAEHGEKAIAADKLNPVYYHLLASIRQEQGQVEAAMGLLRRALYLDHGFVLAHFLLGNIELSIGRRRQAERHFRHTQALLQDVGREEVLPESEGLSAGRLLEIIDSLVASRTSV